MSEEIAKQNQNFEDIKHVDESGNEYWLARELMIVLGYKEWRYFCKVIEKAITSCQNSNVTVDNHFGVNTQMVNIGSGAEREQIEYKLSRYACYLIAQNANPRLRAVALAQTYFALQTRKQELTEREYKELPEEERRLYTRQNVKDKNKYLFDTAQVSGVRNFAKFNNAGYTGLYDGEKAEDIKLRKNIGKKEDILDYMGNEELAANLFRITQTEALLKKNEVSDENNACITHNKVGKSVRNAIRVIGGTMPEKLPTPKESIKEIEKKNKKEIKNR